MSNYQINSSFSDSAGTLRATASREGAIVHDEKPAKTLANNSAVSNGVHQVTVGADGGSTYSHHEVLSGSSGAVEGTSGPVFTSPSGAMIAAADAKGTDIVKLPNGVQTSVAAAMAAGLLGSDYKTANSSSTPSSTSASAAVQQQQVQEQQKPAEDDTPYSDFNSTQPIALPGEAENLMQEGVAKMNHGTASSIIGTVIAGRQVSTDQLQQVSSQLGVSVEEAQAKIGTVIEGMRQQVLDAVGPEVVAWAQRNDPDAVTRASRAQALEGSLRGWGDLNGRFMQQLDKTNPQAIVDSEAGKQLGARIEPNGQVTLDLPNGIGRVSWQVALRSGFIAPRFGQVPAPRRAASAPVQQATQAQQGAERGKPVGQTSNYPQISDNKKLEFVAFFNAPHRTQAERKEVWQKFSKHYGVAQMRPLID
jgi:hypothetical protein